MQRNKSKKNIIIIIIIVLVILVIVGTIIGIVIATIKKPNVNSSGNDSDNGNSSGDDNNCVNKIYDKNNKCCLRDKLNCNNICDDNYQQFSKTICQNADCQNDCEDGLKFNYNNKKCNTTYINCENMIGLGKDYEHLLEWYYNNDCTKKGQYLGVMNCSSNYGETRMMNNTPNSRWNFILVERGNQDIKNAKFLKNGDIIKIVNPNCKDKYLTGNRGRDGKNTTMDSKDDQSNTRWQVNIVSDNNNIILDNTRYISNNDKVVFYCSEIPGFEDTFDITTGVFFNNIKGYLHICRGNDGKNGNGPSYTQILPSGADNSKIWYIKNK